MRRETSKITIGYASFGTVRLSTFEHFSMMFEKMMAPFGGIPDFASAIDWLVYTESSNPLR